MKHTYSPEDRKARLDDAKAELTAAVESIATSDQWLAFLKFSAQLHQYSAGNQFWLYAQQLRREWDDLGHVASFNAWKRLGRSVIKGEKSLKVLAPLRYKTVGEDGAESFGIRGFTVESVFAARQTEGEGEVPERIRAELLTGEGPAGAWLALSALVVAEGFTVTLADDLGGANGTTQFETHQVKVLSTLDEAQQVKTLAHELAHVLLHAPEAAIDYGANRGRCEAEAESTAFLVCSELGIVSDAYSFAYVASWSKGDSKIVTAAADKAVKTANKIVEALEVAPTLVDA